MDTRHIDLINLVGVPLTKKANTNGGEWHGECPFCGGKDRFWVAPNDRSGKPKWYCRHCTPQGGDAVAFVMKRDNVDFKQACAILGLTLDKPPYPRPETRPQFPTVKNKDRQKPASTDAWQKAAGIFAHRCEDYLWSWRGKAAMDYLRERKLATPVLMVSGLGYNPQDYHAVWGGIDIYLPEGITIPWYLGGYTTIRVRRLAPTNGNKYAQTRGMIQSLYQGVSLIRESLIAPYHTVVLVEGELDALAIRSALYWFNLDAFNHHKPEIENILPVALGSITNGRTLENVLDLALAERVLLAFDNDGRAETQAAMAWWAKELPNALLHLPTAKDPNEMLIQQGFEAVGKWLLEGQTCAM